MPWWLILEYWRLTLAMEGTAGAWEALTGAVQVLLGALYSLTGAMEVHPGAWKALTGALEARSGALDALTAWKDMWTHWMSEQDCWLAVNPSSPPPAGAMGPGSSCWSSCTCAPVIYTAPCVMLLMRAASIYEGKWEGGRALEIKTFLGPVQWHGADRRMPFGAHK